MPLLELRPSVPPLPPPPASRGAGGGGCGHPVGAVVLRKDAAVESYCRKQQQEGLGFAKHAKMWPNLKRCGGSAAIWEWTLSRRRWRELGATARIAERIRSSTGGFAHQQRQGVESCDSFSGSFLNSHNSNENINSSSDRYSGNAVGSTASGGGASTSGSHLLGGSRIVRALNGIGETREFVGSSGNSSSYAFHSSGGCRQVSFGWKRRDRKDECESISIGWNGDDAIQESRKRFYTAASQVQAAVETTASEAVLRRGALVEFERESGKIVLAVAQNREGKRNWTAIDESGTTHIVRPQQITYLVPNHDEFEASDIAIFLDKVDNLQDLGLLEFAWEEVLTEKVAQVRAESLAKILYASDTPVECYTVHRMLSGNQIFFRCKQKGLTPVYEPRPLPQVKELQQKRLAEEKDHQQLLLYAKAVKLAVKCPLNDKPAESTWHQDAHFQSRTESLGAYALGSRLDPAQKKSAEEVIEVMGLTKNPAVVTNLLIGMGVFPVHVNVDLLKIKSQLEFMKEHVAAAQKLCEEPPADPDLENRVDLTAMKVYTIDSDDTDEIDDGLSATRLPDGRIRVWIHIADPTRWLPQDHALTREAESRGTSIYLPAGSVPMFPVELATGQMSLRQGHTCCAVTVSVILQGDGSIAEYSVMNSTICPTYKLSYDNVAELLLVHIEEEPELYLLAEAATCRAKWRTSQGAMLTFMLEPDIKVKDPDSVEPAITLDVKDQSVPAMQLVAEMMILCGEAVASFGGENNLCLPYRGQAQTDHPQRRIDNVPDGPCKAFAVRRFLGAADLSFIKPLPHASLGLPGYVQFTSPIRRFSDLLSHYQIKAYMRGDKQPFSAGNVEAKMAMANIRNKDARKLQSISVRYWTIEYFRRQPKDRQYTAVVLQAKKDGEVPVLLVEVGFCSGLMLTSTPSVGTEILVVVVVADPRKSVISFRQCWAM